MKLPDLHPGTLVRRYKRFLADVRLDSGDEVTAWCPNPGAMTGCGAPGWRVHLSPANRPGRKLAWTWELSWTPDGTGVLVHTGRTNALAHEALLAGLLPGLRGYDAITPEVTVPGERSRIDFRLTAPGRRACWVEVKAVTLPAPEGGGMGAFPDAKTARGRKHLGVLTDLVAAGDRAVQLYVLPRSDLQAVRCAAEIDPDYAVALGEAASAGVEVLALRAAVEGAAVVPLGPGAVELTASGL